MVRELITVQVGQCGNQIGYRFWDRALREHAQYQSDQGEAVYDEAMSSFFRNVDTRYDDPVSIDVDQPISTLKARAVLVDMEEGVVQQTLKSDLGELFDTRQFLTDVSGSGNNWAHGYGLYGAQYAEEILEKVRRPVEFCDSLQSFFVMNSLGGGTGSGLGSRVMQLLYDEYPHVYRFATSVFPSEQDDVITSPYNSVLALHKLSDYADCVFPIENQALLRMCQVSSAKSSKHQAKSNALLDSSALANDDEKPFDAMNNIAAQMLLDLTASMRFEGSLNIDLNEISMNLVPYPRLHFLTAALSPLHTFGDVGMQPRRLDQMFTDGFDKANQLIEAEPRRDTFLACALMVRGHKVDISDIRRNINRMKDKLDFIYWNQEGWKVSLCSQPPVGLPQSLLTLSNNCCISDIFSRQLTKFNTLYDRKAYVQHYKDYVELDVFDEARDNLMQLIQDYEDLRNAEKPGSVALGGHSSSSSAYGFGTENDDERLRPL